MLRYFQLIGLIIKHGQLKSGTENINRVREENLQDFHEFIPTHRRESQPHPITKTRFQNLIGQVAFIKNSFRTRGGHLVAKGLGYIRIPKSASTSLSLEMLAKKYPALKERETSAQQINFLTDVNLTSETDGTEFFTIVRNPLERIVSVYRDFFEHKNASFIYSDYLFGILSQNISFGEFINRITCIPDRLKDQHLRPQHTFLKFYQKKNVSVQVFKLENPELLIFLSSNSLQLPHLNKSREAYDYRSYFDLSILNKARELYAHDIHYFGYEKELQALEKQLKTVH